jgi:aspartate/methionine/tyrosine aminotransferase
VRAENTVICIIFIHFDTDFFISQGAIPQLLENTKQEFFGKTVNILQQTADICWEKLKDINCITCPSKPEGSLFVMVCE